MSDHHDVGQSGEDYNHITDKHVDHHHEHYDGHIPVMPFFRMIRQRHRWGEKQELPHGDFSDTFIDLFYVAAAYNLGHMLKDEPSGTGILYFVGCFLPLQTLWLNKTYFYARFLFITNDVVHETLDKAHLLALSTAISHIRPVPILSNPKEHNAMFILSLSLSVCYFLHFVRLVEILVSQKICEKSKDGNIHLHPEAFGAARRDIAIDVVPIFFCLAAALYSGLEFYGNTTTMSNVEINLQNTNKTSDSVSHRLLADSYTESNHDNIPIWLLLGGILANNVVFWYFYWIRVPSNPNRKDYQVPLNVSYMIHRYGEWVMLMMGESVLSLLIVGVKEAWTFFGTLFCGILSMIFLHYLHFRSQPHDPDEHAMRRSVRTANAFVFVMQIYSASLVVLGASYKSFLYAYVDESHRRRLSGSVTEYEYHRWLTESYDSGKLKSIANLFSGSMAVVFICMEGITFAHEGFQCETSLVGLSILLCRFLVIAFVASLSQYDTSPRDLSGIGLACIVLQVLLRIAGSFLFYPKDIAEEEAEVEAAKALMNEDETDVSAIHPA